MVATTNETKYLNPQGQPSIYTEALTSDRATVWEHHLLFSDLWPFDRQVATPASGQRLIHHPSRRAAEAAQQRPLPV